MSNPSFVTGSIFGSAKTAQPSQPMSQPNKRGRISSPNRGMRGARGAKPKQRGNMFGSQSQPQEQFQAPQNVNSSGDVQVNRGSIFGTQSSSSPQKPVKKQSGGASLFPQNPAINPRRSFRPERQIVGNNEFMTYNKGSDSSLGDQSKLMNRAQQAVAHQFGSGRGQFTKSDQEFAPRGRGLRGRGFRATRGRGGRDIHQTHSQSSRGEMDDTSPEQEVVFIY